MVSISDQNPEIRRQTDGQQSSVTAPANENSGIFRVGLTRTEAATNTQLNSLFTKYNADGDDTISQSEFDAYTKERSNQQQQDITSASGKRTAVGGIYTIQKGDSLYAIAKDFGMSVSELYQANVDVIGKSINSTIHPGQQLKITKTSSKNPSQNTQATESNSVDNIEATAQEDKKAKMAETMRAFGIDINNDETRTLLEKFKNLDPKQKHKILDNVINIYVDFDNVNRDLAGKSLDEIATTLGISEEDWNNADWEQKGTLLAEKMNAMYKADLDPNNENSCYNKALARLRAGGATDRERELYGKKFNFDNLSDKDCELLAKMSVKQEYISTSLAIAHQNIKNGRNEAFAVSFDTYMKSMFSDQGSRDFLMFMADQHKDQLQEYMGKLSNNFAQTYKSDGTSDKMFQALALEAVADNADAEHLAMLYQNNPAMKDVFDEVIKYVAENTTDESRRAMLNNIVENSASIVQGNNSSVKPDSANGQGSSASISSGLGMTNPIQNSFQTNYINNLRQASEAFHTQSDVNANSSVPEEYRAAFSTIREYIDFKGTGMTMAEYQRARSALKNNFTSVMNDMIENYANIPDKFKPRILSFFDSMDNNTSGELYLGANDKVRQFMDKYNYMTDQKLLQYVQNHPAELNEAPKTVQQIIKDLQDEQAVVQS